MSGGPLVTSPASRARPRWSLLLGVALCLACGGAPDVSGETDRDSGPGPVVMVDGGVTIDDAGRVEPPPPLHPSEDVGLSPAPGRFEDAEDPTNAGACYDHLDNDDDADGLDCADSDCAALPSCCVASASAMCCQPAGEDGFDASQLAACEGDSPASCVPSAAVFGAPRPIVSGGLLLGGDGQGDSGLLFAAPYDLRTERLVLTADVQQATTCGPDCLESVAFGVTAQTSVGDAQVVEPLVALVVSGPLRQARLVVGGAVVARWPEVGDDTWTLELRPDGEVWVARGAEPGAPVAFYVPAPDARVVAWGHSRNPSATEEDAARLRSLSVRADLCDIPRAWRGRAPLRVEHTLPLDTVGASGPTLLLDGEQPLLVYEWEGALYAARSSGDPLRYFTTTAAPEDPLFRPNPSDRVRSPELVPDGAETWLYYVREAEDGTTSLRRARLLDGATRLDSAETVSFAADLGTAAIDDPTIVPIAPPGRSERWAMVLRVGGELRAFASDDGRSWTPFSTIPIAELHADEVREPALVVVGGGYQLFVSVRHGTRWRQALFASAEFVYWRLVDDRATEGAGEGREALGVRDLDVLNRGDSLEVVYLGLDGVRETLHRAARRIPQRL